ncbi:MAG: hypothetical protein LBJ00_11455 [Planctomycetaceae bacterium]|jgi:hypothetical protein|nr:hypothetical protein [Planctomycetaceae bacterium]
MIFIDISLLYSSRFKIPEAVVNLQRRAALGKRIPKPVWAAGFAPEQPLRDATLACSASGIQNSLSITT